MMFTAIAFFTWHVRTFKRIKAFSKVEKELEGWAGFGRQICTWFCPLKGTEQFTQTPLDAFDFVLSTTFVAVLGAMPLKLLRLMQREHWLQIANQVFRHRAAYQGRMSQLFLQARGDRTFYRRLIDF